MSHELSLQCYLEAKRNPEILPYRYADLEDLLGLFWRNDFQSRNVQPEFKPFRFPTRPPELLLVDDEQDILEVWKIDLVQRGYPEEAIRTFLSGEQAAVYAQTHNVQICLLDVQLLSPYMLRGAYTSGIRVLQAIKDKSPSAKVILISGFVTFSMVQEAIIELGASYHLQKPFETTDLSTIVQWAVDQF